MASFIVRSRLRVVKRHTLSYLTAEGSERWNLSLLMYLLPLTACWPSLPAGVGVALRGPLALPKLAIFSAASRGLQFRCCSARKSHESYDVFRFRRVCCVCRSFFLLLLVLFLRGSGRTRTRR